MSKRRIPLPYLQFDFTIPLFAIRAELMRESFERMNLHFLVPHLYKTVTDNLYTRKQKCRWCGRVRVVRVKI